MSPKDLIEDNSKENSAKPPTSVPQDSVHQSIDNIVDSITSGQQLSQESVFSGRQDIESVKSGRLQTNQLNLMKNQIFGIEMPFDVISAAFASTVAIGGLMGYLKAKSTYSLIAGLVFGGVLGFGAYQTSVNPRNYYLTLGTSVVLGALMGYRALNSGKFMPAGLVASLSALMVIRFTVRYITDTNYIRK
ncbi:transmembrane protein 14C-like [Oppia nitens]|uniref:transmembrane protein 14C-like n=1 Tax=Oppia nitens TaxID=1686743 RepID=UPI0023D9D177|nr:transmembrane protein 14C-like [Oppia nitens]